MSQALQPIGSSAPWSGGKVTKHATCLLAPNPGVLTLDGTNTWLIGGEGPSPAFIIDPGPLAGGHGQAIVRTLEQRGARAAGVLLTHGHADHSEGALELARRLGCGVRALDPRHRLGEEGLTHGDVVEGEGLALRVVGTPGHSADSLTFFLEPDAALLTGDTVLGRGTSVVAHPDGRLSDYLKSLHRLRSFADSTGADRVLPGHGPPLSDPVTLLGAYLEHRLARLDQVRAAIDAGSRTAEEVVEVVYREVPRNLWPAALMSVRAQLEYLQGGKSGGF